MGRINYPSNPRIEDFCFNFYQIIKSSNKFYFKIRFYQKFKYQMREKNFSKEIFSRKDERNLCDIRLLFDKVWYGYHTENKKDVQFRLRIWKKGSNMDIE